MNVRLPNGQVIANVPDGTSQTELMQTLQANGIHWLPEEAKSDPTAGMSGMEKFNAGLGKSMVDVARGVPQLLGLGDQALIDEARRLDAPLMNTGAGMAGDVVGNIGMALAPGAAVLRAGKAIGSIGAINTGRAMLAPTTLSEAALQGASLSAVQPTATGDSRFKNMGEGALGGATGQGIVNSAMRVARPVRGQLTPELSKLADKAVNQFGIPLNAAQISGNKSLKWADAVLGDLPFVGETNAVAKDAQRQAFNRAALGTVGETADRATPEVLNAARQRIGGEFQRLTAANNIPLDTPFLNQLATIESDNNALWPTLRNGKVRGLIDDALEAVSQGSVSGVQYQKLRSALSKQAKDAFGSQNSALGKSLKDLRGALDDAAERSLSPDEMQSWQLARQQWGNLKAIEKASVGTSADAVSGNISPAKLASAVDQSNRQGFRYGTGNQTLPDLARIGQTFLKDLPQSGTAPRAMWQSILTNPLEGTARLGVGAAGAAPGYLMQALLYSKAGRNYLTKGLAPKITDDALIEALLKSTATSGGSAIAAVPND